jgi:cell division protein FtsL
MDPFPNPSSTENARATSMAYRSKFCRHTLTPGWPKRDKERGAGRVKAILWTLVLATFVYVAVKVVPILVNEYQFQDGIQTLARFATVNRQTPEQIRAAVLKEAQRDDIPVAAEDIKIEAVNGNVRIRANYSITVDLKVYQWTLDFHPAASNDSLT